MKFGRQCWFLFQCYVTSVESGHFLAAVGDEGDEHGVGCGLNGFRLGSVAGMRPQKRPRLIRSVVDLLARQQQQ